MLVTLPVFSTNELAERPVGLSSCLSMFAEGEGVDPNNNELWLKTGSRYLHVTLNKRAGHKGCFLHERTWNRLKAWKYGYIFTFQTEGQHGDDPTVDLHDRGKSLLTFHVDAGSKLLEIIWLQGGRSYPGADVKKVARLFIDLIRPNTAYLYDMATKVNGLAMSRYFPFAFDDTEGVGGPGYYGDIGFAPANAWNLVVRENRELCQSRDIYYGAVASLRKYLLSDLSAMLFRADQQLGGEFAECCRYVFGFNVEGKTFHDLMKVLYKDGREAFFWVNKEVLVAKELNLRSNDSELREFYELVTLLDQFPHQIYTGADLSMRSRNNQACPLDPFKSWEEDVDSYLPKPRSVLS